MKIAVVCGMSDEKVHARLLPLIEIDEVEEIFLFRRQPITMKKVVNLSIPAWMLKVLLFAEIYRFLSLILLCLTNKPSILYGIYFVPHGVYAAIAARVFRIPVIQELIGTDRLKVMRSKLLLRLLMSADHIGVRGQTSREQMGALGIPDEKLFTPISVNVIDFELFTPDESVKNYDVIYCGRMDQNKQIDLIIRAVAELKETFLDLQVVFVGDGPEYGNLIALTAQLNLQATIWFAGNQPYEQIPHYLNQSKIFVMASAFEGLPVAMIEALSCGLPAVVPNVGDIADVAQHGFNALLVDQLTVEEFVQALSGLLSEETRYHQLAEGALITRQHLFEVYSLDKAKNDFEQILLKSDLG